MIIKKFGKEPKELQQSLGSAKAGDLIRFPHDSYEQATDETNDACFWIVIADKALEKAQETKKNQNMITLLSLDGKQIMSRGIAHQIIIHRSEQTEGKEKVETTLGNVPVGGVWTFPKKRDEYFIRIKKDPAAGATISCYSFEDHTIAEFDMTYEVTHYPNYETRVKKADTESR